MPTIAALTLRPPIERDEIPQLCERAGELLRVCDASLIVCDVGTLVAPDAVVVDALARLQLTARRHGAEVRVRHACADLVELLELSGLTQVIRSCEGSDVEARREPE